MTPERGGPFYMTPSATGGLFCVRLGEDHIECDYIEQVAKDEVNHYNLRISDWLKTKQGAEWMKSNGIGGGNGK